MCSKGKAALLVVACWVALLAGASAQPVLTFKRVISNWPTIELYFTVGCNGQALFTLQPGNFKVFENGIEIGDFTLWCPDPRQRCAISVALVFDASGSMSGGGNAGAIQAGLDFVSNMDGVLDEASVVWFTQNVTVAQTMTTSKTALQGAISNLPANGATACWDGIYEGLLQVIRSGTNPCRAVIALTDGDDNSSTRTPAEIISLATRNRIRVFTIGLGNFSGSIGDLQDIAVSTGGQFYPSPTAAQLTQIYDAISLMLHQGFLECQIIYNAKCMDGGKRFVELRVETGAPCAGKDSKTRQYTAPKDSSTFSDVRISIGRDTAKALQDVVFPIMLETPILNENLYPITCTISYDSACLSFKKLDLPTSSLIAGVPYSITPGTGTITISTKDRKILNGAGLLMDLTFTPKNQNRLDTVCCPVTITSWKFEQGCFRPLAKAGEVCVIPILPLVQGNCAPAKIQLRWHDTLKTYVPNPISIQSMFSNQGEIDARNGRYRITYDRSAFYLSQPSSETQIVYPRDLSAHGGQSSVRWDMYTNPSASFDSTTLCIIASFDNHPDVRACAVVVKPLRIEVPVRVQGSLTLCEGESVTLVGPAGYPAYAWSDGSTMRTLTVTRTGTYVLTVRDSMGVTMSSPPIVVTVHPLPAPRITPSGPIQLCYGQFMRLTASPGFRDYRWSHGDLRNVTDITSPGTYTVTVTDTNGCSGTSPAVEVRMDSLKVFISPSGVIDLCEGTSTVLDAGGGYAGYEWSTGQRTRTIVVSSTGQYTCRVVDGGGCQGISSPVQVNVHSLPNPKVIPAGPLTLCEGDSVILSTETGYRSYQWSNGVSTPTMTIRSAGQYRVQVVDSFGCRGISSDVVVNILSAPQKPIVTRMVNLLLIQDKATDYQWFLDGRPIIGANSQLLVLNETGEYRIRVTGENGCSTMSDPFRVDALVGVSQPESRPRRWSLHPDPTTGAFTIRGPVTSSGPLSLILHDLLGRQVCLVTVLPQGGWITVRMDPGRLVPGLYVLRVDGEQVVIPVRVVVGR